MSPFFRSLKAYYSILRFGKDSFTWKNCSCLSLSERFLSNVGSTVVDQKLSVANPAVRKYLNHIMKTYDKIKSGNESVQSNIEIKPFIGLLENRLGILENISNLEELAKDKEIKQLVEEETLLYKTRLIQLDEELLETILENITKDDCRDIILEITAGVGGQEAMLFAKDLYQMYLSYLDFLGYEYELLDLGIGDAGGTRHASISVSGDEAFSTLKHEAGVHRVQRIPVTERSGRVHTSTVTVAVLPQPTEIEISLADKDLKIETKRASGAGGQHVNTTDSAVRIVHLPTGVAVECQSQRSQLKNKETALRTLRARIYARQFADQQSSTKELRKSQRGLGMRNEKIRTYNYQQNRVTDHRLNNGTVHNLKGFLEGGEALWNLTKYLDEESKKNAFLEIVNELDSS